MLEDNAKTLNTKFKNNNTFFKKTGENLNMHQLGNLFNMTIITQENTIHHY